MRDKNKAILKLKTKPSGPDPAPVEASMAVMSMAEDSASGSLEGSIPDPVKKHRQSVEAEMDENKVVKHKHRDSTAEGVTPSDPFAIVNLFQEMESIGSANLGPEEGSETGSTTGEGEEGSDHPGPDDAPPDAPAPVKQRPVRTSIPAPPQDSGTGRSPEDDTATTEALGSKTNLSGGTVKKLWGRTKPETPESSMRTDGTIGTNFQPLATGAGVGVSSEVQAASGVGTGGAAPRPYWPTGGGESTATTAAGAAGSNPQEGVVGSQLQKQSQGTLPIAPAEQATSIPSVVAPQLPASGPSVSGLSEGDITSHLTAPLRRKSSMGSFQKGMGESLTGRMRKQLDIPREPKPDVNTNIPIHQIQSLQYLAQGAMCVAYTAMLSGKRVVLKTPLPDTSHAEVAANDLEVEMLLLKELHHDNIVSLLGAGFLPDGRRFVALEYLSGGTLSSRLKDLGSNPLGISKVLDLSLALCNALEYLHDVAVPGRIVCHRDLKPDNIGFAADGSLKLIDFGLGKIIKRKFRVRADSYHMTGGTGSLRYMAPEVADHQKYNEKADVYSFSLIMWEMLSGVKPFLGLKRPDFYTRVVDQGERPLLDPAWPIHVRNLLESCWRTNLDERLSFREVAGILKVCAEEENQRLYFTEEKRRSIRLPTRRPKLWTTTGARPDMEEISHDPHYKPKFKISSFFSHHGRPITTAPASGSHATAKAEKDKNVRRATSNNT